MNDTAIRRAQGARLKGSRREAGFKSARAAALAHGWKESSYRAHESGGRTIGQDDAEKYVKAFRAKGVVVSAEYILFGDGWRRTAARVPADLMNDGNILGLTNSGNTAQIGSEKLLLNPFAERPVLISVRGEVASGRWFEYEQMIEKEHEPIPAVPGKYRNLEQFAFQAVGQSMDRRRIAHGDYVICVRYFDAKMQIESGDIVVIERTRDRLTERSCKEIQVSGEGYELWSRSTDTRLDEPLRVKDRSSNIADDGSLIDIVGLVIAIHIPVGNN